MQLAREFQPVHIIEFLTIVEWQSSIPKLYLLYKIYQMWSFCELKFEQEFYLYDCC